MPMHSDSVKVIAFINSDHHYEYLRMPSKIQHVDFNKIENALKILKLLWELISNARHFT